MIYLLKINLSLFISGLFIFILAQAANAQSISAQESATIKVNVTELPTQYAAGLFFVTPVTVEGDTLLFYTDTGGGKNMLYKHPVSNLHLETHWVEYPLGTDDSVEVAALPSLVPQQTIPFPSIHSSIGHWFFVKKAPSRYQQFTGFLARMWFAGRVWDFNYPEQSLGVVVSYDRFSVPEQHRVPLGFQTDEAGHRTTNFARIQAVIAGDTLDFLFDTGAHVRLTEHAQAKLRGPAVRGTSFIEPSIYKEWHRQHPEWPVIENSDKMLGAPMIQVPEITIAGYTVGPVWFNVRSEGAFYEYMSQWMDQKIGGALGASAFKYFRIIVDYPNAVALFDKVK